MASATAGAVDSEAEMTRKMRAFGADNSWIWNLDTSEMTLVELEEYKKELLRQEEQGRARRMRNIRLVIYALVLFLFIVGIFMLPGTIRAQNGPVVLTPIGKYSGEQQEGPGGHMGSYVKRISATSFQLWFEADADLDYKHYGDVSLYDDGYRKITGEICREKEFLNRQGKSSVTFSDGTTGTVWYERRTGYGAAYLMGEYKGNVYGYKWSLLRDYDAYKSRTKR